MESYVNQEVPASTCNENDQVLAVNAYDWAKNLNNENLIGCYC